MFDRSILLLSKNEHLLIVAGRILGRLHLHRQCCAALFKFLVIHWLRYNCLTVLKLIALFRVKIDSLHRTRELMDLTVVDQAFILSGYVSHLEQFLLLGIVVLLDADLIFIVSFAWSKACSLRSSHSRLLLEHLVREKGVRSIILYRGRRLARSVCHLVRYDEA